MERMTQGTTDGETTTHPSPGAVIDVADVSYAYRGTRVLQGVSLAVAPGDSLALLGANGAGKTTLLELCAGTRQPDTGRVTRDTDTAIGWVPPSGAYYGRLSARENLRIFCRLEGVADPVGRADDLLASTGLTDAGDRRADRLSTGMGQRLNLAIALAGTPDALLLDEPTATLSPDQRLRFWDLIARLRDETGLAVIFSTQSVPEAGRRADRMMLLGGGVIVFTGDITELAARGPGDDMLDAAEAAFIELAGE